MHWKLHMRLPCLNNENHLPLLRRLLVRTRHLTGSRQALRHPNYPLECKNLSAGYAISVGVVNLGTMTRETCICVL